MKLGSFREGEVKATKADEAISVADPLLTLVEVSKILRCSERTIRRFILSGKLTAVQTGRCYRFRRQDLAEFVRRSLTSSRARSRE
jgi:excisionase family DNA binding protein